MPSPAETHRLQSTSVEIAMLLAASIATAMVLTIGVAASNGAAEAAFGTGPLMMAGLIAGGVLLSLILLGYGYHSNRRKLRAAEDEVRTLQLALTTAEALVKGEPQTLVYWEHGRGLRVVTQTLTAVPGLPTSQGELLRFGMWLDAPSAKNLKSALDTLFVDGRAFNMILRTAAGGHLEADGRAAGGRAILRLRDIAGYKRDVSAIIDLQAKLARDVRGSRSLMNTLPSPAWIRSADGRLSWVNAAYAKAVDAKDEAEVIDGQIELLDTQQRRALVKALQSQTLHRGKLKIFTGGAHRTHELIVTNGGDCTAGIAIDIAELEAAKGQIENQALAYDRTLDRIATAVAIFNADQTLAYFNDAYVNLWSLDPQWLKTNPADGTILDRLKEAGRLPIVERNYRDWQRKLLSTYANGQDQEATWHLPDGRVLNVVAEHRPDGGVTYLYNDETERLDLESRVNVLSGVQNETLNSLAEGVAVFATDGRLQLHNPAFASIWKLSPARLQQAPHIDEFVRDVSVLYDDAECWKRISSAVTSFSADREPFGERMHRPDDSVIDFSVTPLPDGATLLTFADVTDARRAEHALRDRNEALETTARIKNRFIGNMSYELRTPLTNILGFTELLTMMDELKPKQREYLEDITAASKTLLTIINSILDLANIDAGGAELEFETVDVQAVIDAAVESIRDSAAKSELTLDIALTEDANTFVADASRVTQILKNLMSNAVGFSPAGSVVQITAWREDGFMAFAVEDRGAGMQPEQVKHIFERFDSRSQGSKHRGAGLGLAIAKSLVDLHGGDIKIDSEVGRGTLVTVRLPEKGLARQDQEPPAIDAPQLDLTGS